MTTAVDLVRVREAIDCALSDAPLTAVEARGLRNCLYASVTRLLQLTEARLRDEWPDSAGIRDARLAIRGARALLAVPVELAPSSRSYPCGLARVLRELLPYSGVEQ
ncbi:DUF6415 family natural product biosynthesis protein [Streptomyces sp. NPDC050610]|uniref:DUF6415 family natural product biosynthesis protein n=1 Tax=Streptomyces sp. NPDC050610 TaxID=3157097 RepID=UPI0034437ADA